MSKRLTPFVAFLRHRYRAHMHGWLAILLGLLWGYYIDLHWHEPLWAVVPVAFVGAFFVVSVGVAVAALLRAPWWLFAPAVLVSMSFEWMVRKVARRPWRRRPQPHEPWLSNPFALWAGRRLRRPAVHACPHEGASAHPCVSHRTCGPARAAPSVARACPPVVVPARAGQLCR